jgi:uncharacterized protein (TIGR03083 family)
MTIRKELAATWGGTLEVCADLTAPAWARSTDCPGWTVQDVVAHLLGAEARLAGREAPPEDGSPDPPYVRNPLGHANEAWVRARRHRPGAEVLEEFRTVTGERLAALGRTTPEELSASSWTPAGTGTYRDLLLIRIFDSWVHEQDIRRALGRPGHLAGPVAERCLDQVEGVLPYVVGKKAQAPEGSRVAVEVTGPTVRHLGVEVAGGRGRPTDAPGSPTVRLVGDFEAVMALACGRWEAAPLLAEGRLVIEGDRALGTAVADQLSFVP